VFLIRTNYLSLATFQHALPNLYFKAFSLSFLYFSHSIAVQSFQVARRLGRLRDLLSADPSLRAPRVALGCLDGIGYLTALGRRYLRHLEIAEPLTEIMRLLVAYSGSDALKTALVADGRVVRSDRFVII